MLKIIHPQWSQTIQYPSALLLGRVWFWDLVVAPISFFLSFFFFWGGHWGGKMHSFLGGIEGTKYTFFWGGALPLRGQNALFWVEGKNKKISKMAYFCLFRPLQMVGSLCLPWCCHCWDHLRNVIFPSQQSIIAYFSTSKNPRMKNVQLLLVLLETKLKMDSIIEQNIQHKW